jgi:hypothetical protein
MIWLLMNIYSEHQPWLKMSFIPFTFHIHIKPTYSTQSLKNSTKKSWIHSHSSPSRLQHSPRPAAHLYTQTHLSTQQARSETSLLLVQQTPSHSAYIHTPVSDNVSHHSSTNPAPCLSGLANPESSDKNTSTRKSHTHASRR